MHVLGVRHGVSDWLVLPWARDCVYTRDTAVTQTPALEVLPLRWVDRLSPPAWQPWGPRWGAASTVVAQTQM